MDNKYLVEPFTQFDSAYLESLPDEVFFGKRFVMSEEDQALLMQNSSMVHGRRFYRAKVRDALMEKYAAMTNPQGKEPGTKENPLIRFGREYVYNEKGNLVPFVKQESVVLTPDMKPTKEQAEMARAAASQPVKYSADCPKSSPERLKRFREYGSRRNELRQSNAQDRA